MRALIVHEGDAGADVPGADDLRALCADAGHAATIAEVRGDWRDAIARADLVVAAGGDRTVAAVARTLAHHAPDTRFAILPLGGTNAVAGSLGLVAPTRELVAGWTTARTRPFDVGRLTVGDDRVGSGSTRAAQDEDADAPPRAEDAWFVRAVGVGMFARAVADAGPERAHILGARAAREATTDPAVERELRALRRQARRLAAREWRVSLDGDVVAGRFLFVEVLNVPRAGPHLVLAPSPDPGDGLLDVALLDERDRDAFVDYADRRLAGDESAAPPVTVRRARRVVVAWDGAPAHVDDEPWPPADRAGAVARGTRVRPVPLVLQVGRTLALLDATD